MSYHSQHQFDAEYRSDFLPYHKRKLPTHRDLLKAMFRVAEARRRIRLEEYTPPHPETSEQMRHRIHEIATRGIARVSYCVDTHRASVAWIEPSSHYQGDGAAGLMFLREDIDLDAGTSTGCYPFAAISWHAMTRLVERSDVNNLDHMERAAAAGLSWSHVARDVECDGEYHVPHSDGIFCCVALPQGVIEGDRAWPITLMKTWISEEELDLPLFQARNALLTATRAKSPFFPGFNDIEDWQDEAFFLMRESGRRKEHARQFGYAILNDERFSHRKVAAA